MTVPDTTHPDVAACLADAWSFLTGEPMSFEEVPGNGCQVGPGPCDLYLVAFNPPEVKWQAGVIVGLSFRDSARYAKHGKEICNIFAGCLAPVFARREEFTVGLPTTISADEATAILAKRTFSRSYANADRTVRILAFEIDCDKGLPAENSEGRSVI